jgi:hypothetical protein
MKRTFFPPLLSGLSLAMFMLGFEGAAHGDDGGAAVERIVCIRHGEKPAKDLGQLDCQGLNRALALPKVLISHYGKADFIFAPLTSPRTKKNQPSYSYIRPLMTIEPTAIRLGLPVDARFAFDDIDALSGELTGPAYQRALVFVAWEHTELVEMLKKLFTSLGADPAAIPHWEGNDFDSIYLITIRSENGKRSVSFQHDQEGLNGMKTDCDLGEK